MHKNFILLYTFVYMCLPMAWEIGVPSQVESYQWYLMPLCLTLHIIRYESRVSGIIKGVTPFPTPWCGSHSNGSLQIPLNLYDTYIYIYIYIVIHRQTVSLHQNSSVWRDTQDTSSWDWNPPNFTLDFLSNHSAILTTYISSGIIIIIIISRW